MHLKIGFSLAAVFCLASTTVTADTIVFDTLTGNTTSYGHGNYGISNINNGDAGTGTYNGASPAFGFNPSGIAAGEVLSRFVVPIGNDRFTGVKNFDLTLFTSGGALETNPLNWSRLGSWSGQTTGSFDSQDHANISVAATPVALTNGNFYYLMATVPAGQGLETGDNNLDWGTSPSVPLGNVWEPLLDGLRNTTFRTSGGQGTFEVFVTPDAVGVATPEPGSLALLTGIGLSSTGFLLRRRNRRR